MQKFVIEKLSEKIPIVRDEIWSVYIEDKPKFTGTLKQCCDWVQDPEKEHASQSASLSGMW